MRNPQQEVALATMESEAFSLTDPDDAESVAGMFGMELVLDEEAPQGEHGQWWVLLTPQQTTWLRDRGELYFTMEASSAANNPPFTMEGIVEISVTDKGE